MAIISYERKPGEKLSPEETAHLEATAKKLEAMDDSEIDFSDIPNYSIEELREMRRLFLEKVIAGEVNFPIGRIDEHEMTPELEQALKKMAKRHEEINESEHVQERRKGA